jgi:hypothetical protein
MPAISEPSTAANAPTMLKTIKALIVPIKLMIYPLLQAALNV